MTEPSADKMTEPTTDALKCLEEIHSMLEVLLELSKSQQRLLTQSDKASVTEDPHGSGPADFSTIMVQREQLVGSLQDKEAYYQKLMSLAPEVSGNAEIRQSSAQSRELLDRVRQSDHYVMQALALVQERTAQGLLKNIKLRETLKSYHEAIKANDLLTRIFGDNPRRIDARR